MTTEKVEPFERFDVRLPSRKVLALKRLADKKNYEQHAEISWVDLLRQAIDLILEAEGIDLDAAPETPVKAKPAAGRLDFERFRVPPCRYGHEPHHVGNAKDKQLELLLLPSRRDAQTAAFVITPETWTAALKYCKQGGYRADDTGGMSRETVLWFRRGLEKSISRGRVPADARPFVESLIAFCDEDGRFGFTLEKRWRSARRQAEEGA